MRYRVTIVGFPQSIRATKRVRSGVIVDRVTGYEGELTEEQLAAIKGDSYLKVEKVESDKQPSRQPAKKTK